MDTNSHKVLFSRVIREQENSTFQLKFGSKKRQEKLRKQVEEGLEQVVQSIRTNEPTATIGLVHFWLVSASAQLIWCAEPNDFKKYALSYDDY